MPALARCLALQCCLAAAPVSAEILRLPATRGRRAAPPEAPWGAFVPGLPGGAGPAVEQGGLEAHGVGPETLAVVPEVRLPLADVSDFLYTVEASLGEGARRLRLLIDTGSSNLVVAGGGGVPGGFFWGEMPRQVLLSFAGGQVWGVQVREEICMTGLCIVDQTMVSVTSAAGIAGFGVTFDGILGLGFPALGGLRGETFLQVLNDTGPFQPLAFGLDLRGDADGAQSALLLGSAAQLASEARSYGAAAAGVSLPVEHIGGRAMFWAVRCALESPMPRSIVGILDSGTSLLAVPAGDLHELLHRTLPADAKPVCGTMEGAADILLCPCSTPMRPLRLSFEGDGASKVVVTLTSRELLEYFGMLNVSGLGLERICRVAIQPSPPGMPFWLLGDVFLRQVFVVHDVAGERVVLYNKPRREREPLELAGRLSAGTALAALGVSAAAVGALLGVRRNRERPLDVYMAL